MKKISLFWVGIIALVAVIMTFGIGYYGEFFGTPAGGVNNEVVTSTTLLGQTQTINIVSENTKQVDIYDEDRYTPGTELDVAARCFKLPRGSASWNLLTDIATTGTNDVQLSSGDRIVCMVGNDNATTTGFSPTVAVGQNGTDGWYVEKVDYVATDASTQTAKPTRYTVKQSRTEPTVYVYDDAGNTVISTVAANQTLIEGATYNLLVTFQTSAEEAHGHPIDVPVTGLDYSNVACLMWNSTIIKKNDMKMVTDGSSIEWKSHETPALMSTPTGNSTKCWKVPFDIMGGTKQKAYISLTTNPDTTFGTYVAKNTMRLHLYDVSMYQDTTSSAPRDYTAFKFGIVDDSDNDIGLPEAKEIDVSIGIDLN